MIAQAETIDPDGYYRLIEDGDLGQFQKNHYDLIFSGFMFDNIPNEEYGVKLLKQLALLLNDKGKLILLDSTPDIYTHE